MPLHVNRNCRFSSENFGCWCKTFHKFYPLNFIPNNYINLEEPASYSKLKYTYMFILLFVKLNDSLKDSSLYFICISIYFETFLLLLILITTGSFLFILTFIVDQWCSRGKRAVKFPIFSPLMITPTELSSKHVVWILLNFQYHISDLKDNPRSFRWQIFLVYTFYIFLFLNFNDIYYFGQVICIFPQILQIIQKFEFSKMFSLRKSESKNPLLLPSSLQTNKNI